MTSTRVELVGVVRAGLSTEEAARRLAADGRNDIRPPAPPSPLRRTFRLLADPLIVLLLLSATVTLVTGDIPDTAVILLVIVVNTAIGVAQEIRADRAVAALGRLGAPHCRVVRDGADVVIAAAEAVRGDLVRLSAGDIVPADIALVEAHRLQVDESAVTGESVPVDRTGGEELSAGTVVAAGRGDGTVVRIGAASALGRIATLTASARGGPTPLQRRLARLGRVLGTWTVALSALVTAIGIVRGRPPLEMAIVGVSLVVAAVPESLPAVVTLALALGARRMAAAHAVTRRLNAVETLGSVDTLLSDKTGTLTQGRMAVEAVATAGGGRYSFGGRGYDPDGTVRADEPGDGATLRALATAAVLCNDATLLPPHGDRGWTVAGEHIEGALLVFAARAGTDIAETRQAYPRTAEEPFDQRSRMMTTEHRDPRGRPLVVHKGAPETILHADVVDVTGPELDALREQVAAYTARGLRTLAVASGPPGKVRALGVLGIGDPVRDSAPDALGDLAGAGVRTVMVTGDHPRTGQRVAERVGIWAPGDRAVDCSVDGWDPDGAADARVFARARPEQKLEIVDAMKRRGAVIAVTGDGVNDAPALRRADIGVAMGGGTEVAHQAAQLVLADDELATVAVAVREGRRVYDNIRRFLRYALSGGVAELLTMLAGPLFGLAVPLLPAQLLWINLLTHGLPGVAMGAEPIGTDVMRRPPRPATQSVLGAGLGVAVLWTGGLIGAVALAVGATADHLGLAWQTLTFVALGFSQLGVAIAVRAPRRHGQTNRWLGAAVGLSAALMLAGVYLAPLRDLLGTEMPGPIEVLVVLGVSALPGLVVGAVRRRRG